VQDQTRLSVKAIDSIGEVIGKVKSISTAISAAVEEQGAATREISQNAQRAAQGTQNVSHSVEDVAKAVAENEETGKRMISAAERMGTDSKNLRERLAIFIDGIRKDA
jgi:methyl-accepting chemotaxis protein